jgi:hypothetical protein
LDAWLDRKIFSGETGCLNWQVANQNLHQPWTLQVGRDYLLISLPFHRAHLWNAPWKQDPVLAQKIRWVISLQVGFVPGKQVV